MKKREIKKNISQTVAVKTSTSQNQLSVRRAARVVLNLQNQKNTTSHKNDAELNNSGNFDGCGSRTHLPAQ